MTDGSSIYPAKYDIGSNTWRKSLRDYILDTEFYTAGSNTLSDYRQSVDMHSSAWYYGDASVNFTIMQMANMRMDVKLPPNIIMMIRNVGVCKDANITILRGVLEVLDSPMPMVANESYSSCIRFTTASMCSTVSVMPTLRYIGYKHGCLRSVSIRKCGLCDNHYDQIWVCVELREEFFIPVRHGHSTGPHNATESWLNGVNSNALLPRSSSPYGSPMMAVMGTMNIVNEAIANIIKDVINKNELDDSYKVEVDGLLKLCDGEGFPF